jgi:hypothetical protein
MLSRRGLGHQPPEYEGRAFLTPRLEGGTTRNAQSGSGSSVTTRPISRRSRTMLVPPVSPRPKAS